MGVDMFFDMGCLVINVVGNLIVVVVVVKWEGQFDVLCDDDDLDGVCVVVKVCEMLV